MYILSVYTLPKVVGFYDLSVLTMSVMGFQKKIGWGWVGGVSSIQFLLRFLEFVNFAKPITPIVIIIMNVSMSMSPCKTLTPDIVTVSFPVSRNWIVTCWTTMDSSCCRNHGARLVT